MWYLTVVISILFTTIYIIRKKDILFPGVLFNIWWSIVIWLSHQNINGYYSVSQKVDIIFLIGVIFFNIPCLIYCLLKTTKVIKYAYKNEISIKRLKVFQLILIILMLPLFFSSLKVILSQGLGNLRYVYATNLYGFMGKMERYVYTYFLVFPCVTTSFAISAFLWASNKIKSKDMILGVIAVFMNTAITAGRLPILNALIILLVSFIIFNKKVNINSNKLLLKQLKNKKNFIISCIIASIFIGAFMTFQRTDGSVNVMEKFLNTIGSYFTIGPRLLDLSLNNPGYFGLDSYTYGGVFFAGLIEIFRYIFRIINIDITSYFTIAQEYMGNYYVIGANGVTANAFPTMYYYFIRDLGGMGIFYLTSFFSCVTLISYNYMKQKSKFIGGIVYSFIIIVIFYSVCWWYPYRIDFWTQFIHMIWIIPLLKSPKRIKYKSRLTS